MQRLDPNITPSSLCPSIALNIPACDCDPCTAYRKEGPVYWADVGRTNSRNPLRDHIHPPLRYGRTTKPQPAWKPNPRVVIDHRNRRLIDLDEEHRQLLAREEAERREKERRWLEDRARQRAWAEERWMEKDEAARIAEEQKRIAEEAKLINRVRRWSWEIFAALFVFVVIVLCLAYDGVVWGLRMALSLLLSKGLGPVRAAVLSRWKPFVFAVDDAWYRWKRFWEKWLPRILSAVLPVLMILLAMGAWAWLFGPPEEPQGARYNVPELRNGVFYTPYADAAATADGYRVWYVGPR